MAQKYGLLNDPSISQIDLTEKYSHLIIGSDGFFDKMGYEEVQRTINKESGRFKQEETCTNLTNTARSRWLNYSDDVSSIVIYF